MNWPLTMLTTGAVLALISLLDLSARVALWPKHAWRLLDAAMGNWQFERRHVNLARLRWGLAAVAVLVVLSEGFYSLLFWMPSSWGSVNEDGDWTTTRRTACGMLALVFTALAFAAACARAEHAREREL